MKHISKINHAIISALTILVAILFSSCGMPTKQIVPIAAEGKPPAGKCLIIVERVSTSIGAWVNSEVYDNKTHVGTLTSGGKLVWLREPGPMNLCTGMKMLNLTLYKKISVESGKTYLYKADPRSLAGPGKLHNTTSGFAKFQSKENGVNYTSTFWMPRCMDCGGDFGCFRPGCPLNDPWTSLPN